VLIYRRTSIRNGVVLGWVRNQRRRTKGPLRRSS